MATDYKSHYARYRKVMSGASSEAVQRCAFPCYPLTPRSDWASFDAYLDAATDILMERGMCSEVLGDLEVIRHRQHAERRKARPLPPMDDLRDDIPW